MLDWSDIAIDFRGGGRASTKRGGGRGGLPKNARVLLENLCSVCFSFYPFLVYQVPLGLQT